MKKDYRIFSVALLLLGIAMNVVAQTTAYVALKETTNSWDEGNGFNGCVFAFDTTDPATVKDVVFRIDPFDGQYGEEAVFVQAGTSADDKYYAMCKSEYDTESTFCTLNFATGARTKLSDNYSTLDDMAYIASSKVLYGVQYVSGKEAYTTLSSINAGTGELTSVFDIPNVQIAGIATDGDQKLYGVALEKNEDGKMDVSLYLIDPVKKEAKELHHAIGTVGSSYSYTSDFNEGKLYFISGASFATIDPAKGTMTVSETKLPKTALVGLCFTASSADGVAGGGDEPDPSVPVTRVSVEETWGDILGEEEGQLTGRNVTYYDANNNPIRKCMYGKLLGQSDWQISRYTTYIYNDEKQLIQTSSEQYGLYDGEDLAFKASTDTVAYEYDDAGRLVKETTVNSGVYISYEYDDANNLVKKIRWNPDRYDEYEGDYYVMESNEYSDFKAPNCPQTIKSDGAFESYKSLSYVTYDADNNKISTKKYDISGETLQKAEYWTYEEGRLTLYEQKKVKKVGETYEEQDYQKTVYSLDDDNPNRIKREVFSYSDGKWIGQTQYTVTESSEYSSLFATELSLALVPDEINTVKLTFTLPNVPSSGSMAFDVYRHGMFVARVLPSDQGAYDPDTQTISYVDREVKNGLYDYFVQTILLSELGDEEQAFNVSNVAQQKVYVELPAVTNIHYVSHVTEDGLYKVKIAWDEPENLPAELGFQKYNVFVKGFAMPENLGEEDLTETSYDVTFGDASSETSTSKEITIQSIFKFGKVKSEPKVVSISDIQGLEENGINDLIQVNGNQITINNENASVEIIALNGAVLNSYQNVKTVDLSTLDKGIYLAKVVCDGKTYVIKLIK